MTVILGKVEKGNKGVILGCDSQATHGNIIEKCKKIIKSEEFVIIGTGYLQFIDNVKFRINFPSESDIEQYDIKIDKKFMTIELLPALRSIEDTLDIKHGNNILVIAYKNKLFKISTGGDVIEYSSDSFCYSGCGEDFAGIHAETLAKYTDMSNKDIIFNSIKNAIEKDAFCGFPILIANTDTMELVEYDETGTGVTIEWEEK